MRAGDQRRRKAEHAREAILDAATLLFAERGVSEVSLADIGAAAGYSRGLANHHFGSRAALMEQLAVRIQARYLEGLTRYAEAEVAPGGGAAHIETLVRHFFSHVRGVEVETRAYLVMRGAAIAKESPLGDAFAEGARRARASLAEVVRRAQAAGGVREDVDPVVVATWLTAMFRGLNGERMLSEQVDGLEALCVRMVMAGLCVPPEQ